MVYESSKQDLEQWIRDNTGEYPRDPNVGLRALVLPGHVRMMSQPKLRAFWNRIVQRLPADAAPVFWLDSQIVLQRPSTMGAYFDEYVLLFASKAWSPVPEGEAIPYIVLGEKRRPPSVLAELPPGSIVLGLPPAPEATS